jgi:hypothetical protein
MLRTPKTWVGGGICREGRLLGVCGFCWDSWLGKVAGSAGRAGHVLEMRKGLCWRCMGGYNVVLVDAECLPTCFQRFED